MPYRILLNLFSRTYRRKGRDHERFPRYHSATSYDSDNDEDEDGSDSETDDDDDSRYKSIFLSLAKMRRGLDTYDTLPLCGLLALPCHSNKVDMYVV